MSNSKPDNNDTLRGFANSLQELQGNFHILEQQVPVQRQIAYFKFSDQLKREHPSTLPFEDKQVDEIYAALHNEESEVMGKAGKAEKRRLLTLLAISRSVKAFRLLQTYLERPDPEIADWAAMALMESRLALESELSDEKQIYIATAMGGKGQKLRFSIVFYAKNAVPFLPYQRQTIEDEVAFHLSHADCEIERLEIKDQYVQLLCLIPVKIDVQFIFNKILDGCNEFGDFLEHGFTISNVHEITEEEILREIESKQNEGDKASD
ncbi:MAG: hypothetical protein ACI3ZY_00805 [Parabacteroides sp.]